MANISTPQKITAKSDSFAQRIETARADNEAENASGASGNEGKSGRALPELGGKGDGRIEEKTGFDKLWNNILAVANSMGLTGTERDNVVSKGAADALSGGGQINSTVVASMVVTADKVVAEPQKALSQLSPEILALARNEKAVIQSSGAGMDNDHSVTFAGVAKPQETGGGLSAA